MTPNPHGTDDIGDSEVICHSTKNKEYLLFRKKKQVNPLSTPFDVGFLSSVPMSSWSGPLLCGRLFLDYPAT